MTFNFDCVFYYVRDLDRSIKFYTDVLGFTLESRDDVVRLYVDDILFELVPVVDESKLVGSGNARLCLKVVDIQVAVSSLREKGVPTSDIQSMEHGKLAVLNDPDGNEVVLWQYS
jgi:catechol 2,3-dioxygenase-like lactoylglutathione lyase family enzyme